MAHIMTPLSDRHISEARQGRNQKNIHHRADDWARPVWRGRNSAAAAFFFASTRGYDKSFVSNNHKFCFLGASNWRGLFGGEETES
jgi:hypothetical protein